MAGININSMSSIRAAGSYDGHGEFHIAAMRSSHVLLRRTSALEIHLQYNFHPVHRRPVILQQPGYIRKVLGKDHPSSNLQVVY